MANIIAFTKYTSKAPSSRYRTFQYINFWKDAGYIIEVQALFNENYIKNLYSNQRINYWSIIYSYFKRVVKVLFLKNKRQILYIEYELLPYLPEFLERYLKWRGFKFILDYDDAIFHFYDINSNFLIKYLFKNKIPSISKIADHIITGSPYLTNYFLKFQNLITEIPTSIIFNKYKVSNKSIYQNDFIIGWIGTNSTSHNIKIILKPLRQFFEKNSGVIHLVGFDKNLEFLLYGLPYKIIDWTEENELNEIEKFSVGIMPLNNSLFNNGKCGFKLIQYMACEKPTISTPLEANIKINKTGKNLFATNDTEWLDSFTKVYTNRNLFNQIGIDNKLVIMKYYSVENNYTEYIKIFDTVLKKQRIS